MSVVFDAVGVIGAGAFGRALARRLAHASGEIRMWIGGPPVTADATEPPLPPAVRAVPDLGEAAACGTLFLCVPAPAARDVCRRLGDHVQADQVLVHAARGLEAATGLAVSAVVQQECCLRKVGVVGGALRAQALNHGRPVAAVVASRFDEVLERTASLLDSPTFRVLPSRDLIGVEIAGAYRSLCALWVGVVDGLELGHAARALIMTEGLREAAEVATRLEADPMTFMGYAGVGDLIATAADQAGGEHEAGVRLAAGDRGGLDAALEAVASACGACALAGAAHVAAPVADGLRRVLEEAAPPRTVLRELFGAAAEGGA